MPAGPPPSTTTSNSPKTGVRRSGSTTFTLSRVVERLQAAPTTAPMALIQLDRIFVDDRLPALDVGLHRRAELGRRVGDDVHVLRAQLVAHLRVGKHAADLVVD